MDLLAYTIVGTVIGTLLAIEAKAWLPYISASIVRSVLGKMPEPLDDQLRSRWSEEIEADLTQYDDRPLGGFLFALRLRRRGGKRLAEELALEQALSTSRPIAESKEGPSRATGVTIHERDGRRVIYATNADGTISREVRDFQGNVLEIWVSDQAVLARQDPKSGEGG